MDQGANRRVGGSEGELGLLPVPGGDQSGENLLPNSARAGWSSSNSS